MSWTYKKLGIIGKYAVIKSPAHPLWEPLPEGNWSIRDMSPERVGKRVLIEYSYNQMFGDRQKIEDSTDSYSVVFEDGNSVAWLRESQLQIEENVQSRSNRHQSKHTWPEDHNLSHYLSTHALE